MAEERRLVPSFPLGFDFRLTVLKNEKNNVCVVCMFVCDSENAYCVDHVDEEDSEKY